MRGNNLTREKKGNKRENNNNNRFVWCYIIPRELLRPTTFQTTVGHSFLGCFDDKIIIVSLVITRNRLVLFTGAFCVCNPKNVFLFFYWCRDKYGGETNKKSFLLYKSYVWGTKLFRISPICYCVVVHQKK
jgi:hypothetical protein